MIEKEIIKIKPYLGNNYFLNENYSSDEIIPNLALVYQNERITKFFRCKDYIQDVLWLQNINNSDLKDITQYGFQFTKRDNVKFQDFELLFHYDNIIKNIGLNDIIEFKNNLTNFINKIETKFNFELSKTTIVKDVDKYCILITQSPQWSNQLYLMSFYILLCRIGIYYKDEKIEDYIFNFKDWDKSNIERGKENILLLLNNDLNDINHYFIYTEDYIRNIHDFSGIVNVKLNKKLEA